MSNAEKAKLLRMPYGTANGRLRKMLLFKLAGELGRLDCYRCDAEMIDSIEDFSIEHIEPWMSAEDPVEAFFDLDNIAFSHITCNVGAANREKTHCPQGHLYGKDRTCSKCQNGNRKRFRDRHPEQDTSEYRRQQGWRK